MIELRPIGPGKDPAARRKFARVVKAFQAANALFQDGIVGEQTFHFMEDLIHYLRKQLEAALKANEKLRNDLAKCEGAEPKDNHGFLYGFLTCGAIVTILAVLYSAVS